MRKVHSTVPAPVEGSRFPNGFESWQKSHYEVVSALNARNYHVRNGLYSLALELTSKFEAAQKKKTFKHNDNSEEVRKFVNSELDNPTDYSLAILKDLL